MPQAIPIIITIAANGVFSAATALAVAAAAVSTYSQYRARRDAANAARANLRDRQLTLRSAVSPRRWVLGQARVGGTLMYADTVGTNLRLFDSALATCDGPIQGVVGYWLNEEYFLASDLAGERPSTGKYASASTTRSASWSGTLSGSNTFTLPNAPVGTTPDKLLVSLQGSEGYTTLAVASVAGAVVTLTAPATGSIYVQYKYIAGDAPLRIQWTLGDQTLASTWSGVTTPKQSATDVRNGVSYVRALMGWDESIYASGPPSVSLLVQGVREVLDPRLNRSASVDLAGAVAGTPGTLPAGVAVTPSAGLAYSVVGGGTDPATGWPYVDVRLSGTASATGNSIITLEGAAAANGQTWATRLGLKLVAGTYTFGGTKELRLSSYTSGGTAAVVANTAVNTAPTGQWVTAAGTVAQSGAASVGTQVRLGANSGQLIDCTLRLYLPQIWQGAVASAADPLRWTANSALLAAWWARLPRVRGGCGRPWHLINWASVSAAANVCDETITVKKRDGTGYEDIKRYECNTVLSLEDAPAENLDKILSSMAGDFPFTAGQYHLFAGAHVAPTFVIDDGAVEPSLGISISPDVGQFDAVPNMVTATIADAAQNHVETSPPPVVNETYVADDGGAEEPLPIQLPATTDARRANYLMGVALERSRPGFVAELTVKALGSNLALMSTGQLDLIGYEAFADHIWQLRKRVNNFNGTYTLTLRTVRANVWALDPDTYTPTVPTTPPDLSWIWNVVGVTGLVATMAAPSRLPDGTTVARLQVNWTLHSQAYVQESGAIELRYRRINATDWVTLPDIPGDETGTLITLAANDNARYIVEARARNGVGAYSSWSTASVDVTSGSQLQALVARLSSQGVVLPANAAGFVTSFAGASTTASILLNGVDDTANWSFSKADSTGLTTTLAGATVTVTGLFSVWDAAYTDITATRAGYPTQVLRYTVTKAKAGSDGSDGVTGPAGNFTAYVFKRSVTQPATPTGNGTPAGWSDGPPAGTDPLWVSTATQTAAGVLVGVWSTPVKIDGDGLAVEYSVNGASGWHTTFADGDLYMRQRLGVGGAWSGAMRIVAEGAVPRVVPSFVAVHAVSSGTATAGVRIRRNGGIETLIGSTYTLRGQWYQGTGTNPGDAMHVRFTWLPGSDLVGTGGGSWLALTSNRLCSMSVSSTAEHSSQVLVELSADGGTTTIATGVQYLGVIWDAGGP